MLAWEKKKKVVATFLELWKDLALRSDTFINAKKGVPYFFRDRNRRPKKKELVSKLSHTFSYKGPALISAGFTLFTLTVVH